MQLLRKQAAAILCVLFFASYIAATCGLLGTSQLFEYDQYDGGWESIVDKRISDDNLIWQVPEWKDSGKGQTRLLYKDWFYVHKKPYQPRAQGSAPSCVGHATAAAVDILSAVEIRSGEPERAPPAKASASVIYGLSRVEIGGLSPAAMGGSHNLWAAQALQQYGVVAKLNYPLLGVDLRSSSPRRDLIYGSQGVPVGLEKLAKLHPVKDYISVDSYAECRDLIYRGCPVIVGSSIGFGEGKRTRDSDGFLNRPRRLFWQSTWNHSMVIIGVCDEGRKGCLILNSWGPNWVVGPKRFGDEPEGSFWADARIIDQMVKQGDSFALRGFKGYPLYRLQ